MNAGRWGTECLPEPIRHLIGGYAGPINTFSGEEWGILALASRVAEPVMIEVQRHLRIWTAPHCQTFSFLHGLVLENKANVMRLMRTVYWPDFTQIWANGVRWLLSSACAKGFVDVLHEMHAWGATPDHMRVGDVKCLHAVVASGNVGAMRELRSWGLNVEDLRAHNAFAAACKLGSVEMLKELRDWGLDVKDACAEEPDTVVYTIVTKGHTELLRELRLCGLSAREFRESLGWAVAFACASNSLGMLRELRAWGVGVEDTRNDSVEHVIENACEYGSIELLRELLSWGFSAADVRVKHHRILYFAIKGGRVENVRELGIWGVTAGEAKQVVRFMRRSAPEHLSEVMLAELARFRPAGAA